VATEQARKVDASRFWPNRVADVDVDMEPYDGGCQPGSETHPDAGVLVLVADLLGRDSRCVEGDAVVGGLLGVGGDQVA
jgi:hypothetical protein